MFTQKLCNKYYAEISICLDKDSVTLLTVEFSLKIVPDLVPDKWTIIPDTHVFITRLSSFEASRVSRVYLISWIFRI